jgi:hypothetical protein
MNKSKGYDEASHGGGKRNAERQSSDANKVDRTRANKSDDDKRSLMGIPVGPNSDPDDLGKTDLERRAAAATREPAEGPRKK